MVEREETRKKLFILLDGGTSWSVKYVLAKIFLRFLADKYIYKLNFLVCSYAQLVTVLVKSLKWW